jgi:hypothetical protein
MAKINGGKSIEEEIPELLATDETIIDDQPKKRGRKPGKSNKPKSIGVTEVASKLNIIMLSIAKISGRKYDYTESDYTQESKGFCNLADKFPVIANIFNLFDPILIVYGLYSKFINMKREPKPQKQQQPAQQPPVNNQVIPINNYSVNQ